VRRKSVVQRVASTGYVRNRLTVLQGGQANTGVATASRGNAALDLAIDEMEEARATQAADAPSVSETLKTELKGSTAIDSRAEKIRMARARGYEGDSCHECGNFTLVRNGTCLKCDTCGSTTGCS